MVDADGRPALRVEHCIPVDRQPVHDVPDIMLDVGKFIRSEHTGEDVEAAAPVGLENLGVEPAVARPSHRTTVAQGPGPFGAGPKVLRHLIVPRAGKGLAGFVCQSHHRSSRRFPNRDTIPAYAMAR